MIYLKIFELFDQQSTKYSYELFDNNSFYFIPNEAEWSKLDKMFAKITPKFIYSIKIKISTFKFTTKNNIDYYVSFFNYDDYATISFSTTFKKITKNNVFSELTEEDLNKNSLINKHDTINV